MATFISRSPEETLALGENWGKVAQRCWLIGLSGDLGAGKTQLVRGIALGLGCQGRVHSPTFTLVNQYDGGRLPMFHLDLFRLSSRVDIASSGIEDYFMPPGVTVVEWMERWTAGQFIGSWLSPGIRFRCVTLEIVGESVRQIVYDDFGN